MNEIVLRVLAFVIMLFIGVAFKIVDFKKTLNKVKNAKIEDNSPAKGNETLWTLKTIGKFFIMINAIFGLFTVITFIGFMVYLLIWS